LCALKKRGHDYLITTRDKEMTVKLLKTYKMPFISFGKRYRSICGKIYGLVKFDNMMRTVAEKFRPDMFLSHGSMYAAQVALFFHKPHISLEDTDNMEQIRLYAPFTPVILTSTCFPKKFGEKQIRYDGYHELAYLHPNYFKPDPSVVAKLGINGAQKYAVLRFVEWKATHDLSHKGIAIRNKILAVKEFSRYARVFISSETRLPAELEKHRINIPPELIHSVLYYATLFYGESGTMASECAVLGTPSIFIDNAGRLYTYEQEKNYGLVYHFSESEIDQKKSIEKGAELLQKSDLKKEFRNNRKRLLRDKIDVSAFLLWFIENYPRSAHTMKENPDHHLVFKSLRNTYYNTDY